MDIPSLSIIVASISVVVAVIFTISSMRHATKTRQTGLVIQLNSALRASVNDLVEAGQILNLEFNTYKEYLNKHGDPFSNKAFITLAAYYDGLGFLLYKRLIDIEIIKYIVSGAVTINWEKLEPVIEGMRKDQKLPELFEWFEYLYKEMKKNMT